jgi:glyoxylase-like metal-dependent hydrolase (beta-lactamase superfamily II)
MKLHVIYAGTFLCDGGGMFGTVPKLLWERKIKADHSNLITVTMRSLLVEYEDRKVLIETGAGEKLSRKFVENNGVKNAGLLIDSLKNAGYSPSDITDVVHTHLHWDHCGGGTCFDPEKKVVPTFPNAKYHCTREQWENAMNPSPREDDAYFADDLIPVEKSGQLNFIESEGELFQGFELRIFDGHTPGMIVPVIHFNGRKIAYVSDLVPMAANVPLKWVAAYDILPVITMQEKQSFLRELYEEKALLFFVHDTEFECCTLKWHERKGPQVDKTGSLEMLLGELW